MNPQIYKFGAVLAGGLAIGFGAGWIIGYKKGEKEAWVESLEEIQTADERARMLYKVGEYSTPFMTEESIEPDNGQLSREDLVKLKEHIDQQEYHQLSGQPVAVNIFQKFGEDEVETTIEVEEVEGVNPNFDDPEPYIISEEEYQHDAETHDKVNLSWYPADGVLADLSDQPIADIESTVGINNLNHLSMESPTLYVRNDRREADFEITYEEGTYHDTVLGHEAPVMERRGRKRSPKED